MATVMTADRLVKTCLNIAKNYRTLYVSGCFGAPMTAANKRRYTTNCVYNAAESRREMIERATADTFGFDCVCLIKGILWGWDGDTGKPYGGAVYASNGVPDVGENTMILQCSDVSEDFRGIVPGAVVWLPGHIGVYAGDGLAVECSPKWFNGVQITAVGNIGNKAGYNVRLWKKWGKLPYIDYSANSAGRPDETMTESQVRDIVREELSGMLEKKRGEINVAMRDAARAAYNDMDPLYYDLEDVPGYWRAAVESLLDADVINGGTPREVDATDLNIRAETLKAAIIATNYAKNLLESRGGAAHD